MTNRLDKDCFIYLYTHWCGHCKSVEPILVEILKYYQDDSGIEFYRMDGAKNEIAYPGVSIRGFPTFYLFPAIINSSPESAEKVVIDTYQVYRRNPIEYDGERDVSAIISFIDSFRTNPRKRSSPSQIEVDPLGFD